MDSLWKDSEANEYKNSPLKLRAYTSRLLGQNSDLVLHGGGNTSLKMTEKNIFGDEIPTLYVKGSGHDLKTIQENGFAPVDLARAKRLATLETLTDPEMVKELKLSLLDPSAPGPSVEAILHAIIPYSYVDHTHADSVVAISNTPHGPETLQDIYGDTVLFVPYVMPGFILSKKVYEMTMDFPWDTQKIDGMILLNHGVFSFSDDARESYERMIKIVTKAEDFLKKKNIFFNTAKKMDETSPSEETLLEMAKLRQKMSKISQTPWILQLNQNENAKGLSCLENKTLAATTSGPLTPDHVIHTKRTPLVIKDNPSDDLDQYVESYKNYFNKNNTGSETILDPIPRSVIWPNVGQISVGPNIKRTQVVKDITEHTMKTHQWSEQLEKFQPLGEKDLFDVEYWILEQAKLKRKVAKPALEGKVALVTGAFAGIGKAALTELKNQGACVVGLDINPEVKTLSDHKQILGLVCDVTDTKSIKKSLQETIQHFGGLDIVVSNAGIFPPGTPIENLEDEGFEKSVALNLTSHFKVLKSSIPYLKEGIDPSVIIVASKNVPAPGPGASAYSSAKAGLTQLGRVAALELGKYGIRVNMIHPNNVFDTNIWTDEVLENRAKHYNMTVDEYKKNNILKTEITSSHVAELVTSLTSTTFAKTTGAQIPIDGGNERVI